MNIIAETYTASLCVNGFTWIILFSLNNRLIRKEVIIIFPIFTGLEK